MRSSASRKSFDSHLRTHLRESLLNATTHDSRLHGYVFRDPQGSSFCMQVHTNGVEWYIRLPAVVRVHLQSGTSLS